MPPSTLPPAPPEEEGRDACCAECGSLFHVTGEHVAPAQVFGLTGASIGHANPEFPPRYDPAEADRLIGRDPNAQR